MVGQFEDGYDHPMTEIIERCDCGQPLHYRDPASQAVMQAIVDELGPCTPVLMAGTTHGFLVPRHYIALHGLRAVELPVLADRYGWQRA